MHLTYVMWRLQQQQDRMRKVGLLLGLSSRASFREAVLLPTNLEPLLL